MPKRAGAPAARGGALTVDFTGVESGGRAVADGVYLAEVKSVEEAEGADSGAAYLAWKWRVIEEGDAKGATVFDNTSLQPQALWKLRTLLEAIGEQVPDGTMRLVLSKFLGKRARIEVTNETYQGKDKPRITGYLHARATAAPHRAGAQANGESEPATNGEIKKGQKVKFKDEDNQVYKGKVVSIAEDLAKVDVNGEEWEVEIDQLSAA